MNVDYCLILCAGLGTRMGDIGKELPKVIWPVFEKSLLELQIDYATILGCKSIYINIHHKSDVVIDSLSHAYKKKVKFLFEKDLLGSGGAIHNLALQEDINYKGNLLTINGDQFFFLEESHIKKSLKQIEYNSAVLFGLEVTKDSGYNETVLENEKLVSIEKNTKDDSYYTFSGTALIKLDSLEKVNGESNFFETVANFKEKNVTMILDRDVEYWDFGTLKRYQDSMFGVLKYISNKSKSNFIDFIISQNSIVLDKVNELSYGTKKSTVIDLSGNSKVDANNVIVFDSAKEKITVDNSIYYNGIIQKV